MIKVDLTKAQIEDKELLEYQKQVTASHLDLERSVNNPEEFCGWIKTPVNYQDSLEYKAAWDKMQTLALKLQEEIKILVVIGIGGSYLGARAAIEMIQGYFNQSSRVKIIYAGHTLSSTYMAQLLEYLEDKEFAINVISKSGTTTEPAIAFRLLRDLMINKQKKEKHIVQSRIIVTTDKERGILHDIAQQEKYETFVIPNDIGGRYSVLTPVGLFPMAVAGIDIKKVIMGAHAAYTACRSDDIMSNPAYKYAVSRHILYQEKNKSVEILATYELQLQMFCEWWKQLFGESEGKDNKALFPASVSFTTDLHSLGQFIQEGSKIFFETVIKVNKPNQNVAMIEVKKNEDQLNYLNKFSLHDINSKAFEGTVKAHSDYVTGNIPNIILEWETMDAEMFGYASYFFMRACAMSAKLLKVNPFNQPGVEIYKKNMFQLLGKK